MVSAILLGTSVAARRIRHRPDLRDVVRRPLRRELFVVPRHRATASRSVLRVGRRCARRVRQPGRPRGRRARRPLPYFSLLRGDGTLSSAVAYDPEATPADITTAYVTYPDMVTVDCVDDGTFGYLELSITTDPGPRRDDIGGDLTPEWGMHLVDASVAMGDLVTLVGQQSAALGG